VRKILAIDGGGIKGVVPAAFIAGVEAALGGRLADYFDLIAGTSTGGIIALGLGFGLSGAEILRFYDELGPAVFPAQCGGDFLRRLRGAKYDPAPLRRALEATFGDQLLGTSGKRLVIPSLNLETGKVHIYKTAHHPKFEFDYKARVVDVALATSVAPTFFPPHHSAEGIPLIDGGMWANNPTGLAVVEALGVLGWPREELRVLSLGCVTEPPRGGPTRRREAGPGLGYWGTRIVDMFMTAQEHASLGTAYVLVGHEHVLRISPHVGRGRFSLDGTREIAALRGLGAAEAREQMPRIRDMFCAAPAQSFEPFRRVEDVSPRSV